MSGHSKWAQIKRSKGAKDAKRGVLFSKLSKKITLAAKQGNSADPNLNFLLRTEIEKAKAEGMPNDNIERAAKKAFGADAAQITEVVYEGYGPFGTAFIVECATDSTNRAVSNIKHIFSKHGGSMGAQGSVSWQFETKGQILVDRSQGNMEQLTLLAIDSGATDVRESEEGLAVYTEPYDLNKIKEALTTSGAHVADSDIIKTSTQEVILDEEQKIKVQALLDELEDYEDAMAVHTNAQL